jgi:DNA-directed RNA polymerase specialized sigma24 family protein
MNDVLQRRWQSLKRAHPDIIGQCGVMLVSWRDELRHGHTRKLRFDETLATLADRLVNQEARKLRLGWTLEALAAQNLTQLDVQVAPASPETLAIDDEETARLDALIAELPVAHELTIRAQLRSEAADGAPLHEQLGCSPGAARVRLTRARQALSDLLDYKRQR